MFVYDLVVLLILCHLVCVWNIDNWKYTESSEQQHKSTPISANNYQPIYYLVASIWTKDNRRERQKSALYATLNWFLVNTVIQHARAHSNVVQYNERRTEYTMTPTGCSAMHCRLPSWGTRSCYWIAAFIQDQISTAIKHSSADHSIYVKPFSRGLSLLGAICT